MQHKTVFSSSFRPVLAACLVLTACGSDTPSGGNDAAVADEELTGNTGQVLSVDGGVA